jgi:hypothetical protein
MDKQKAELFLWGFGGTVAGAVASYLIIYVIANAL